MICFVWQQRGACGLSPGLLRLHRAHCPLQELLTTKQRTKCLWTPARPFSPQSTPPLSTRSVSWCPLLLVRGFYVKKNVFSSFSRSLRLSKPHRTCSYGVCLLHARPSCVFVLDKRPKKTVFSILSISHTRTHSHTCLLVANMSGRLFLQLIGPEAVQQAKHFECWEDIFSAYAQCRVPFALLTPPSP